MLFVHRDNMDTLDTDKSGYTYMIGRNVGSSHN